MKGKSTYEYMSVHMLGKNDRRESSGFDQVWMNSLPGPSVIPAGDPVGWLELTIASSGHRRARIPGLGNCESYCCCASM